MIDLRKALPDSIIVRGKAYSIYTDYRVWLEFGEVFKNKDATLKDFRFVFKDNVPFGNFLPELVKFYLNENTTPNKDLCKKSSDVLFDYILDGEYIYSSFLQCYNIDLIDVEMHWWKFKALFNGLSEDTKMAQIMQIRGYEKMKPGYDYDNERIKQKIAWSLDNVLTEEEQEAIDEFNNL